MSLKEFIENAQRRGENLKEEILEDLVQAKFVKETYGDSYPRRSAAIPVVIGIILLMCQFMALSNGR